MVIGKFCSDTTALRADDKTFLDQERFIDFLERTGILADGSGKGSDADRTALESGNQRAENLIVNGVQSPFVNLELVQGKAGYLEVDPAVTEYLCEVADTLEEGIGDTGRTAAAEGYFMGGIAVYFPGTLPGRM